MISMTTYDSLTPAEREIVKAMADEARMVLQDAGVPPNNDDTAAIFDEACAKFYRASMSATYPKRA